MTQHGFFDLKNVLIFRAESTVLARLDLSENRIEAAAENLNQAVRLDPSNREVQRMQSALAAKLAEKAQPLPKP